MADDNTETRARASVRYARAHAQCSRTRWRCTEAGSANVSGGNGRKRSRQQRRRSSDRKRAERVDARDSPICRETRLVRFAADARRSGLEVWGQGADRGFVGEGTTRLERGRHFLRLMQQPLRVLRGDAIKARERESKEVKNKERRKCRERRGKNNKEKTRQLRANNKGERGLAREDKKKLEQWRGKGWGFVKKKGDARAYRRREDHKKKSRAREK